MSFVWRLSRAGYNWNDGFDKRIISEDCPLLKVAISGAFSLVIPPGQSQATYTITHNLGYKPQHLVFGQSIYSSGTIETRYLAYNWSRQYATNVYEFAKAVANTTVLSITYNTGGQTAGYTFNGFYYIFYQPITG